MKDFGKDFLGGEASLKTSKPGPTNFITPLVFLKCAISNNLQMKQTVIFNVPL